MIKKYVSLAGLVGLAVVVIFGAGSVFASSPSCPTPSGNTEVGETTAALVGEVTNFGGDSSVQAWFQYGTNQSYFTDTAHQTLYGVNSFCQVISGLTSNQTYSYRAVAQNSAGTSYGTIYTFTTQSLPITVNLLVNGYQGPITLNGQSTVTLSWTSTNAVNCQASGDPLWTGTKATYGSATLS